MKTNKRIAIMLAVISLFSCFASGCNFDFLNKEKGSEGVSETSVKAVSPKQDKIVVLSNETLTEFVESYAPYAGEEFYSLQDRYVMAGMTFSWSAESPANEYVLSVSTSKDLANAITYTTTETQYHVNDLFVDTQYYWQVEAKYETSSESSIIYSFKTAKTPRTIFMEGVKNTRDIGGKTTEDGKKVRQGIAYRGARLDEISSNGVVSALKTYGIKTDLDLRKTGEGTAGGISPLGKEVQYFNYSCPYYWGGANGINNPDNYANLASAIKVFANADNYPIYYHCSIGRDRTSMVSMLILGVLGVSSADIFMDYEMSFLTSRTFYDTASPQTMFDAFETTYTNILVYDDSRTFAESCEAYLLDIGVTAEEIAAIRSNMLE